MFACPPPWRRVLRLPLLLVLIHCHITSSTTSSCDALLAAPLLAPLLLARCCLLLPASPLASWGALPFCLVLLLCRLAPCSSSSGKRRLAAAALCRAVIMLCTIAPTRACTSMVTIGSLQRRCVWLLLHTLPAALCGRRARGICCCRSAKRQLLLRQLPLSLLALPLGLLLLLTVATPLPRVLLQGASSPVKGLCSALPELLLLLPQDLLPPRQLVALLR